MQVERHFLGLTAAFRSPRLRDRTASHPVGSGSVVPQHLLREPCAPLSCLVLQEPGAEPSHPTRYRRHPAAIRDQEGALVSERHPRRGQLDRVAAVAYRTSEALVPCDDADRRSCPVAPGPCGTPPRVAFGWPQPEYGSCPIQADVADGVLGTDRLGTATGGHGYQAPPETAPLELKGEADDTVDAQWFRNVSAKSCAGQASALSGWPR